MTFEKGLFVFQNVHWLNIKLPWRMAICAAECEYSCICSKFLFLLICSVVVKVVGRMNVFLSQA